MGRNWNKFRILMWKNFLLQWRKPKQTIIEIVTPVIFCIMMVAMHNLIEIEYSPEKIYEEFDPLPVPLLPESRNTSPIGNLATLKEYELIYSPNNNKEIDLCMDKMKTFFKEVKSFENSEKMQEYAMDLSHENVFAGIEFQDELRGKNEIPEHVDVTFRFPSELRSSALTLMPNDNIDNNAGFLEEPTNETAFWQISTIYPKIQTSGPRDANSTTGARPSYYWEGFLALQVISTYILATRKVLMQGNFTAAAMIDIFRQNKKIPILMMKRFPNAEWSDDPFVQPLLTSLGMVTVISFIYSCINTARVIAIEKEQQLKETMKIMGLPNWLHWTAWFLKTLTFLLITSVLIICSYKVKWYKFPLYCIFTFTDTSLIFVFFFLYILSMIAYCFAVSVFFSKANTAAAVAGIMAFFTFLPYQYIERNYESHSSTTKLLSSLLCNSAMPFGFRIMLCMESTHEGSHWDNIWETTSLNDNISLGLIMVMLIVDALIYFLIMIYVETVFPGEFGVPQPFYFFVTKAYWCGGRSNTNQVENIPVIDDLQNKSTDFFERDPDNLRCAIQIIDLRKVFHKKIAVRNLTFNMYDNQITVLLGHNGAGKTTTLSMLMGMFPPTSGTAIINGFDIRHNMDNIRSSMGICPQHNILFDDLTVKEHLYFYGKLKGLSKSDIKSEITNYVDSLELTDKLNSKSSTLSGGMKRKLSVAVALCGRSKLVMLDEPSAGMDPGARRVLWNLIQKEKDNRIILLTTHFMDEADLLGDRIAIMAGGQLQCCGSSFFLKKKFSAGYRLILDKSKSCDTKAVTGLLKRHIRDIEVYGDVGSELTYVLMEKDSGKFEQMLTDLEANLKSLGVLSYGISLATLEEVFMKVGADLGQEEAYNAVDPKTQQPESKKTVSKAPSQQTARNQQNETRNSALLSGCSLIFNQFLAMLMKKGLSVLRSWLMLLLQNLIPVMFVILAIVISRSSTSLLVNDYAKLELSLDSYSQPVTLIETDGKNDLYLDFYKDALGEHKHEIVGNISKELLKLTEDGVSQARMSNIVGVSIKGDLITTITAWFNNNPLHTPPLALALALNIPYKQILGKSHSIAFSTHPFPDSANTKVKMLAGVNKNTGQELSVHIAFAMSFVSSFYVLFYVKERVCRSKHLQFISGAKFYVFWITAYICDLALFMITVLVTLIAVVCFQEDGFKTFSEIGRLFFLLFIYAVGMLPLHYISSYLFDEPAAGFVRMTLFNLLLGVFAYLVISILSQMKDSEDVGKSLHWGFLVIPLYSLASGISSLHFMSGMIQACKKFVNQCMRDYGKNEHECWNYTCSSDRLGADVTKICCSGDPNYYAWERPGIGYNIFYCLTVGISLFLLLLIIQSKILLTICFMCRRERTTPKPRQEDEDADVFAEKTIVHDEALDKLLEENALVLKDLTKYYSKFLAVNGICLRIEQSTCFGLLGTNGAGKTTTFEMLTGEVTISSGNAWVKGRNIGTELQAAQKLIGYCPQFDALLDNQTVKETLIMFALIRGVRLRDCRGVAETLAKDFDFSRHLKKQIKELSGGNKRKVSSAIAMIGDPPIIYLDEPTAGMDPATRRHLWDSICKVRDSGKCVVLTSHSMEECEALCTRLAIMVNGNFKCIGSTQHLKSKFGEGYILTLKVKKSTVQGDFARNIANVEGFVQRSFPRAVQREKHQEMMTYYIEDKTMSLAKMFGVLEAGKKGANIEDYSLGQSSLEQVFLFFARHQV